MPASNSPTPPSAPSISHWREDNGASSSDSDDDASLSLDALLAFCEGRAAAELPRDVSGKSSQSQPSEPESELSLLSAATDQTAAAAAAAVTCYETDASGKSSSSATTTPTAAGSNTDVTLTPEELEQQRLRAIRLGKRQRQRERQRDELKWLATRTTELERELAALQAHHDAFAAETAAAAERLQLQMVPHGDVSQTAIVTGNVWSQTACIERESLRTSLMENARLRAQYECQLQIANGLKRLYEHQGAFATLEASPDFAFLPKKPRLATVRDDATVFATLGCDFDAQYAQLDAIFAAADLATFDGELTDEMRLHRDETTGAFYYENLYSKVFPFDVPAIGAVLWQTLVVPQLQSFHGSYTVLKATDDVAHTKVINTITLPDSDTEVTLIIRVATKRFRENGRSTSVWEGLIEAVGAVSVRLRETGWNMLRPAHLLQPGQRGPVTIEQACVRITPEVEALQSESSLAVGTLLNVLIGSYHRHMELVHLVADDLLAMQFENISLGD